MCALSLLQLTFEQLEERFQSREGRLLPVSAFTLLRNRGALRRLKLHNPSPASITYDLQDICRTVRNLIYQMTDDPSGVYYVRTEKQDVARFLRGTRNDELKYSVNYQLEFSGDCTRANFDVDEVMRDFRLFFEPISGAAVFGEEVPAYRLKPNVIAGEPSAEERERLNKKKEKKGNGQRHQLISSTMIPERPEFLCARPHNEHNVCRNQRLQTRN